MEYCIKCGNERSETLSFCANCGNEFAGTEVSQPGPASQKKAIASKPVVFLAIGVVVAVVIALGVWALLPKGLPLTLNLSSKDDVTFSNDCRPQMSEGLELADAIKVSFNGPELDPKAWQAIAGTWSVGDTGECVFTSSIMFPSGAEKYSIELDGGSGSTDIASNLLVDPAAKDIQIAADVTKYKTIKGSLTLFVDVSSYTFRDCINSWAFVLGGSCGSLNVSTSGICSGAGGYSDIGSGTVIRVVTDGAEELGIGKLSDGKGATILDWDIGGDGWETECKFQWSVEVPEVSTDYRITISDRGERSYAYQDLAERDWTVDLSLGQ